ncbi:BZ3500_MvSof-1268-A1-R1_Chr4-4g07470 [Microbotryum saponariae]|uniref:BZ3500_MvSof-1268-A1-R1_Chr4-4g07470 protein n=1 Tax=Microbotryum saponariae TaxID=289078 RepID=A0A2X0LJ92_9BASI|nr:BZ3500_MvSof-1268-A1-R1_Chr4-4g07470 [Microbotryum saponariae]SDA07131.1 BZ3501_MvSof-1269-A2-R1_Chr4-3g07178 [Microbotryum saponariae]
MKLLLTFSVLLALALSSTVAIAVDRVDGIRNTLAARGMSATADCAGSSGPIECSVPKNLTLDDTYRKFVTARELQARLPRKSGLFSKSPFESSAEEMLVLYALIKQGVIGDLNIEKPGYFDLAGKAKYTAWKRLEGMPCDEARIQYVALFLRILRDSDEELGREDIALILAA